VQDRASEFDKETLDEVEPACVRVEANLKVRGLISDPVFVFGEILIMIVEGQLDRGLGRMGGVEKLENFYEFGA
jgi:hypothetical protein